MNQTRGSYTRYLLWLWVIMWPVLLNSAAHASSYRFQHLLTTDVRDGDSISASTSIVQDRLGFMWFGGENGLARYDGHLVRIYQANPDTPGAISSSYIWDMVLDQQGVLWVATTNGLNRYDPTFDTFHSYTTRDYPELADNLIRNLAVDSHDNLYIATANGLSILNAQRDEFRSYVHTEDGASLAGNFLRSVFVDRDDRVWVGTNTRGLDRFDPVTETFHHYGHLQESASPSHNSVTAIAQDGRGNIWVGTYGGGVSVLDESRGQFKRYRHDPDQSRSLSGDVVWDIFNDRDNQLWIATASGGVSLYQPASDDFDRIESRLYDAQSLLSDSNRYIFQDREGDMWIGSFPVGINYLNRSSTRIESFFHRPDDSNSPTNGGVLSFLEDSRGRLWIGTEGGLNEYDQKTGKFRRYTRDFNNDYGLRANAVLALEEDVNGDIWVGTWGGGLHRFERSSRRFYHYHPEKGPPGYINSEFVWDILLDHNNDLWVGTETGGLNRYVRETDSFESIALPTGDQEPNSLGFVWTLLEDQKQRLWAGTLGGLVMLDPQTETFKRYQHQPDQPNSLSSNLIAKLYEDSRGRIWIGTQDQGITIFDPAKETFQRLNRQHGLPSQAISSFIEDEYGFIWAATVDGLARIDPGSFSMRSYNKSNGLISNNYNRDASYKDQTGRLYFGGIDGFSVFYPTDLDTIQQAPPVVITGLSILNQPVGIGTPGSPLLQSITRTREISLDHHDSTFSLTFAALSYRSPDRNKFEYMLKGFDKDWIRAFDTNTATYTNIDPGTYYFRVRAANSDGVWNEHGTALRITILPAPWRTWWAYTLYACIGALIVLLFVNTKLRHAELEKEKRVNAKLRKLDQLKDSFLANTSHELRTPLNGIIGLAEALAAGAFGKLNPEVTYNLNMIAISGKRLSALINDILDFSKLSEDRLILKMKPVDLYTLVHGVFALLRTLADNRHIHLINKIPPDLPRVEADENRLQQVFINLIGNAIKYTDAGYVRVTARLADRQVCIEVEDTGTGIPEAEQEQIFSAFTQVESTDNREYGGTGLGLAITRQLIHLHGGKLRVKSQTGQGSVFSFNLKIASTGPQHLHNSPEAVTAKSLSRFRQSPAGDALPIPSSTDELELAPTPGAREYCILIVDDDPVNRMVLSSILALHNYQTLEANSGMEAIQLIEQEVRIDLIILDVMMPRMSGFETCMRIRVLRAVESLPILFLTAKHFNDDLVRGFVAGGNDFLTKPIAKNELLSRVNTHLRLLTITRNLARSIDERAEEVSFAYRQLQWIDVLIQQINHSRDSKQLLQQTLDHLEDFLPPGLSLSYWQYDEARASFVCHTISRNSSDRLLQQRHRTTWDKQQILDWGAANERVVALQQRDDSPIQQFGCYPRDSLFDVFIIDFEQQLAGLIIHELGRRDTDSPADRTSLLRIQAHITAAVIKAQSLPP